MTTLPLVERIPLWGPLGFLGWSCRIYLSGLWLDLHRPPYCDPLDGVGRLIVSVVNRLRTDPSIRNWANEPDKPYDERDKSGGGIVFTWFKDFDPKHDEAPDGP